VLTCHIDEITIDFNLLMDEEIQKIIIGRLEKISLPDFGLKGIEAKIDTGAYNGAIHVSESHEEEIEGEIVLKFTLLDETHPEYNGKTFSTKDFEKKVVRNSIGGSQTRYLIPTRLVLKNKEFNVKLGLTDRREMRYPVLIGRKIIKKHFVVDAAKKFTKQ